MSTKKASIPSVTPIRTACSVEGFSQHCGKVGLAGTCDEQQAKREEQRHDSFEQPETGQQRRVQQ